MFDHPPTRAELLNFVRDTFDFNADTPDNLYAWIIDTDQVTLEDTGIGFDVDELIEEAEEEQV